MDAPTWAQLELINIWESASPDECVIDLRDVQVFTGHKKLQNLYQKLEFKDAGVKYKVFKEGNKATYMLNRQCAMDLLKRCNTPQAHMLQKRVLKKRHTLEPREATEEEQEALIKRCHAASPDDFVINLKDLQFFTGHKRFESLYKKLQSKNVGVDYKVFKQRGKAVIYMINRQCAMDLLQRCTTCQAYLLKKRLTQIDPEARL